MEALLEEKTPSICGQRHGRDAERVVYRWGTVVRVPSERDGLISWFQDLDLPLN